MISERSAAAAAAHDGTMVTGVNGRPVPLKTLFELNNGGPMDNVFNYADKELIRLWIVSGARAPGEGLRAAEVVSAEPIKGEELDAAMVAAQRQVPRRHLIGMGAIH